MQSSDYATFVQIRAREAELNRIAECVRIAYERQDELRAERAGRHATVPGRPKNSGGLAAAVAAMAARLGQKWSRPAAQTGRSRGSTPAQGAELEREKLRQ